MRLATHAKIQGRMGTECDHCGKWISMIEPIFSGGENDVMHWACALEIYPHMSENEPLEEEPANG